MQGNHKPALLSQRALAGECGGMSDAIGWELRAVRRLWPGLSVVCGGLSFAVDNGQAIAVLRPNAEMTMVSLSPGEKITEITNSKP